MKQENSFFSADNMRLAHLLFHYGVTEKDVQELFDSEIVTDYESAVDYLIETKGLDRQTINRDSCIISHRSEFWNYSYNLLETESEVSRFWAETSVIYRLFRRLDLSHTIELACGRGRHVPHYMHSAEEIVLVDALEENIIYCARKFKDNKKIRYYHNNGHDLKDLNDASYTSIISYDSMVHFELFDIFDYLKETYRVLAEGGYGLFHHSNYEDEYRHTYFTASNAGSRCFMSKKLFAYLAYQAGLDVIEQHVIDWCEPEMDCVTLVQKPFR